MERTRETLSHDRHNIVSQISFPDQRKFEPKQTDGHARWKFSSPIGMEKKCTSVFQSNKKKVVVVKQVSFISWNQRAATEVV